jgi:NADPH:quinone reductase-like Zn-dependent oxidoreductase
MVKRQRIIGSVLRARPIAEKALITAAFREAALDRFARGELKPVIHEVLPLAETRRAHELVAANANTGKVILQVDPSLT